MSIITGSIIVTVVGTIMHPYMVKNINEYKDAEHPSAVKNFLEKIEPINQFLLKLAPWQWGLILCGVYIVMTLATTFLPLVGTILTAFCGVILFYSIYVSRGRIAKKLVPVVVALVVVCALIIGFFSLGNLRGTFKESEINKAGSSIDWGDDYYWDSNIEGVKKKFN